MTIDSYDAVVVGAGPAGSMTARELARRGARVLLVDRATFPRSKVCGCCVNPRALHVLELAGLGGLAASLGAVPLTSMELASGGRRAVIGHPLGVALSREAFDLALIEAAMDAGASFEPGTTATLLQRDDDGGRGVRLRRDGVEWRVRGRFVVSATGLADSLAEGGGPAGGRGHRLAAGSKIGAGCVAPRVPDGYAAHRIWMACGADGYVGLVALEDGRLDLAAAMRPEAVRDAGGIGRLAAEILATAGLPPVPGVESLAWKGTPALTRTAHKLAEGGVFRVGDAAGYVEPFTGEGMAWALAGALKLAEILACGDPSTAERAWAEAHRREVGRRQVVCRAARLVLRTPWMMRGLLPILRGWPTLARPVIRAMHHA
ncbi:NAD(P)/FAD-dependent oxidoreductase [Isosphaeraceae bacterium EP7]